MTQYKEVYSNGVRNSDIAVNGSEYFGLTQSDYEGKRKFGSFNKLIITQSGIAAYTVLLDGLTNKAYPIPSTGSFTIKPEEGLYFDFVVITNTGSAQIDANSMSINYAKSINVGV